MFASRDVDNCVPCTLCYLHLFAACAFGFVEKYNCLPPDDHEHHPSTILCLLAGEFRQAGTEEQVWGPMRCCQTHESENAPTMGFVMANAHHTPHGRSRCGTAKPSKRFPFQEQSPAPVTQEIDGVGVADSATLGSCHKAIPSE